MYSGILPLEMKAIVAGFGGLKAAKDVGELLWRSITTPDEIRSDNFYYLWKVSKGNVKPSSKSTTHRTKIGIPRYSG
jgi:hypothetical protein